MDDPGAPPPSEPTRPSATTAPAVSGPTASTSPGPVSALAGEDWPARAADLVEDAVAQVHDRVVRPLILAARGIVFGLIIFTLLLVVTVLVSVALTRILNVYVFDNRVWASDALVGLLFTAVGLVAWWKRERPAEDAVGA